MVIEEIKIEAAASVKTVKELRKELKDLRDQLLNTEQGTEEYNQALRDAANIQKQLKDQMLEVNNSAQDFGQVVGNVTGVLAGMAGAVTAVTGTLSLFGIENDEAQKKITATMTALIGLTQGLSKIDSGIKAFKRLSAAINLATASTNAFTKAIIATGIGALVVAVGLLAANWEKVSRYITEASRGGKDLLEVEEDIEKTTEEIKNLQTDSSREVNQQTRLMKAQGATEKQILEYQVGQAKALVSKLKLKREELGLDFKRAQAAVEQMIAEDRAQWRIDQAAKARDKALEAMNEGNKALKEAETEAAILEATLNRINEKGLNPVGNKSGDKKDGTEYIEKRLKEFEDAQKSELTLLDERYTREKELFEKNGKDITLLTKEYESERKRIIKETEDEESKIRVENAVKATKDSIKAIEDTAKQQKIEVDFDLRLNSPDDIIGRIDKEKEAINTIFDIEKTAIQDKINALNELLGQLEPDTDEYLETQNSIASATIELQNLTTENYIKNKELENEKDEQITQLRMKRAQQTVDAMNGIANIIGAVSDAMESQVEQELKNGKITDQEYQRKMKVVKGMQIAMTTIQMLTGIATALSGAFTTKSGPWDIALAAVQAASIAASGIASIVKIKQTEPDGATGSASSYVPSVSIPSVVTSSGDFTQSVDGALTQTAIEDQRVYVLEHDITETQNKVEVAESRARY